MLVQAKGMGWDKGIPAPIICPRQINIKSGRPRTCRHQLLLSGLDCVRVISKSVKGNGGLVGDTGARREKQIPSSTHSWTP